MMRTAAVASVFSAAAADLYCPSADDFVVAYCDAGPDGDKPCPALTNGGWRIEGGGGAATKSAFNLLNGGFVEFDIDLSNVDSGVNANIYAIAPESFASDHFNKTSDYCDGAATGDDWCMEEDYIEANGHCGAATTWHTVEGPGNDGCTAWGCRVSYHLSEQSSKVHMKITYDDNAHFTVTKDGEAFTGYEPAPDQQAYDVIKSSHETRGVVVYGSEWTGWVPVDDCGTTPGNLYGSSYSISNMVISGSVVKGPEPTKCDGPTPAPTPPSPTPAPTPPAPTPAPSAGCCSWAPPDCGDTTDYCAESQDHCETDCEGQWIPTSVVV